MEGQAPAKKQDVPTAWAKALVEKLKAELDSSPEPLREARLHYEIGRLQENPLGDVGKAAEHLHKAHLLRPEHVPTLHAARRIAISRKQFQDALPLFDAEARVTSDPKRKALLYYEKGRLLDERMAKKTEARTAFANALELDRTTPSLLKAMERAEESAQAWKELDRTLEAQANAVASDPRHRAAIVSERARLMEAHRDDARAAAELYGSALGFDEHAPGALHALKRLHYAHGRWKDLIAALETEARQATEPAVRAMALYRVARVSVDRLGALDDGLAALERALEQAPDDRMLLEEVARLYEAAEQHERLAVTLEKLTSKTERPSEKVGLLHRLGQLCEEKLEDEEKALVWYEQALSEEAGYAPALAALGKLYTRRKQWAPLIAMHLREGEATKDPARRASSYARVAEIQESQLGSTTDAMEQHARALTISPGYAPSFKALTRLYAQAGRHRELADLYEQAYEGAKSADEKIAYLFKIARLQEDALGDPALAVGTFQRILEIDGNHLGAIHAVQRAAERAHRWKDLLASLELETQKVEDAKTVVALLHRAGEVCELHLDDQEGAMKRYRKVLDRDPKYAPALSSIGRLYYAMGRWEDLLDTYKLELEILPKGVETAALLYKMGELCEERAGRDEEAIGYYRRAIDADAFHSPSLDALGRLLTEKNRWDEQVKLLGLELSSQKDPERRARTAFRMGEVFENRLDDPEKALAAYEQALGAVPAFRPARDGRARLLAQGREFKKLAEELDREAKSATDPSIGIAALVRQGEIWRDELREPRKSIACFDEVLKRDPKHIGALLALESLYAEIGAWDALAQLYAVQARVYGDAGARVAALRDLARLFETRGGGSRDQIKQTYFAVLQLSPTDPVALGELELIALDAKDAELLSHVDATLAGSVEDPMLASAHHTRLAEALEARGDPSALDRYRTALGTDPENLAATNGFTRLAEQSDDAAALEEAAGHEARIARDRETAARLYVRASDLRAIQNDHEGAIGSLKKALDLDPDHQGAAERLGELMLLHGKVDALLDALSRATRAARKPERRAAHSVMIAELFADHKKDVPTAISTLNRVSNELPGHVPTLMKLADLYARDRHWSESVDRLTQVLGLSPPRDVYVQAHLQLAEILDDKLGDPARAVASLEAALEASPRDREALKRLLGIQIRREDEKGAAETAGLLVQVSTQPDERADALTHLAKLERSLGRKDRAAGAYKEAVAIVGLSGTAGADFKDMLVEQKLMGEDPNWAAYIEALEAHLAASDARPSPASFLEIARVMDDELGRSDQALATLQRALTKTGENAELRMELASRMQKAGHYPQAVEEFRRMLEVTVTRPETWRDLAACFQGMERRSEAVLAMSALVALGAANDLEQTTVTGRSIRSAAVQSGEFDGTAFRSVGPSKPEDEATERLLGALSESLGKIHPPELDQYGLSSRDRITSRSGNPFRALCDRIAMGFGLSDYDLYVHRAHSGSVEVELSSPPSVLVPAHVLSFTEPQQVFLVARILANVARGIHAIDKLGPPSVELLLAAAARNVQPGFGAGLADEDYLNNHSRRVSKSVAWLSRKSVDEAASGYATLPKFDVPDWMDRAKMSATRAALIMSDDLPGAIDVLRRTEGDLAGLQGAALAEGMALVHDLLRFSVSDRAITLRRRLGLL